MSQCIKTGARILYLDYGVVYSADIFKVGECFLIRFNPASATYSDGDDVTHKLSIGKEGWHSRCDAGTGTTVVPKEQLSSVLKMN